MFNERFASNLVLLTLARNSPSLFSLPRTIGRRWERSILTIRCLTFFFSIRLCCWRQASLRVDMRLSYSADKVITGRNCWQILLHREDCFVRRRSTRRRSFKVVVAVCLRYFAARSNSVIGRVGYILEICCIFTVLKNKIPPPDTARDGSIGGGKDINIYLIEKQLVANLLNISIYKHVIKFVLKKCSLPRKVRLSECRAFLSNINC